MAFLAGCGRRLNDGASATESTDGTGSTTELADTSVGSDTGAAVDLGTPECVPQVELGAFEQITLLRLGFMEVFDIDEDGRADLVGSRGVVAFDRPVGFEVDEIPGFCEDCWGAWPGAFGGDERPDLLSLARGNLLVLDGGHAGEEPIVTTASASAIHGVRDVDGDGIDDVAIGTRNGTVLEVWRGSASGTFEPWEELPRFGAIVTAAAFAMLEPPELQLAVLAEDTSLHLFEHRVPDGFVPSDELGNAGDVWLRPASLGSREIVVSTYYNSFQHTSDVSLIARESGAWSISHHRIENAIIFAFPNSGDLDGDGLDDVVLGINDTDIVLLCYSPIEGLRACGRVTTQHRFDAVAALPDPPRVVYSSQQDGTWIAPVTSVTPCE